MGIISAQNLVCSSGRFLGFGLLMRKNFIQQITQRDSAWKALFLADTEMN